MQSPARGQRGRRVLAGSAVSHLQIRFVAFKVYQVQRRGGSYYGSTWGDAANVPKCPLVNPKVAGNSPVYSHGCKPSLPVAEGAAGNPSCRTFGRILNFRYSSQG